MCPLSPLSWQIYLGFPIWETLSPRRDASHELIIICICVLCSRSSLSPWQNLGFREVRCCLQPGGLSSSVHAQEICHPPRDEQPHPDRDGPQCLHRGNQSSEEATDGWGMKFTLETSVPLVDLPPWTHQTHCGLWCSATFELTAFFCCRHTGDGWGCWWGWKRTGSWDGCCLSQWEPPRSHFRGT